MSGKKYLCSIEKFKYHDYFLFNFSVCGESEVLDILINAKADPNTPDIHGAYPIHYAAQMCGPNSEMGNETKVGLQVLRKLISLGVDVNVTDHEDRQPLTWAAGSGSSDAILRFNIYTCFIKKFCF